MDEKLTRQAQDMFEAAKDARIPENVQAFAEDSVAKTRDAYNKFAATAQDNAKVAEELFAATQKNVQKIGETVLKNSAINAEAAFDAAEAIARAKTIPEAARLQANFFQQQLNVAGAQTKEILELSTKVAKKTFESVNAATTKSFDQLKNVG